MAFLRPSAVVFLAGISACASNTAILSPEQARADLAARGRYIAVTLCASCHAIDEERDSPRPDAPPMLTLIDRYDPEMLTEDLIEGIRVGHDGMPNFDMSVLEADALVAYLKSLDR